MDDVPRLKVSVQKMLISEAILYDAFTKLGYPQPKEAEIQGITDFVRGKDVLICLPTGEGKSLCFVSLPLVFDYIYSHSSGNLAVSDKMHSVVIVVTPLKALMKDQVAKYSNTSLQCAFIGEDQSEEVNKQVSNGDYQIVYTTPETLLCVLRWREVFRSAHYQKNIVGLIVDEAHCIEQW